MFSHNALASFPMTAVTGDKVKAIKTVPFVLLVQRPSSGIADNDSAASVSDFFAALARCRRAVNTSAIHA